MMKLLEWISVNQEVITLGMMGTFLIVLITCIVLIVRLNKTTKKYRTLLKGMDGNNLEKVMLEKEKVLERTLLELGIYKEKTRGLEEAYKNTIQKVGLVKFNAFENTGGELSYSVALLNFKADGIVISSIYSRDDARTYCKPVKGGGSSYPLSKEEEQAIYRAIKISE
ncbi:MAG: DUF4446 family protein [Clostridia bacterium]|nr:DUF4446 family protein [Clostridia bacterium]MDD4048580.1 DUF4446 family protein [Clostridia bacterium]